MSSCHLPLNLPASTGSPPYVCCPPAATYEPRLFRPNSSSSPRMRRAAHSVDEAYAAKLAQAYALMKALPPDDPRSFIQQANIHCAYCNTVYNQMGSSELFQIHNTWLFFPFHRWYIYFHERILAKLLGEDGDDPAFFLSFWNYDHPDGASIPWLFSAAPASSSRPHYPVLSNASRDSSHDSATATVALDFNGGDTDCRRRSIQLRENDNTMYRVLIRDATTPESFFGWPYRQGDSPMEGYGFGTVEYCPHNTVHSWVGNKSAMGWRDMGAFFSSGLDPLFYAHHAQIDRLWELWKAMPNHEEIDDEDYKNAEFLFYNEEGELVRVRAGDASDASLLGYVYEEVETPWKDAIPEQRSFAPAELGDGDAICEVGKVMEAKPCSVRVERDPEVSRASPWLHDHLVLSIDYQSQMMVDVYLNLPAANATTDSGCKEFVTNIGHSHVASTPLDVKLDISERLVDLNLDISERLVDLNLTNESRIVVTLVPRIPLPYSSFQNLTILDAYIECALPFQRWDGAHTLF
ncbi:hypothetical protein L7F22_063253 [Adiantum nelumboides]|nr:hypothetical protein [Adiantum nelumboides]